MRIITTITSALLCGTALCLIISMDRVTKLYNELGVLLPGMTEDLLDLHAYHGDWLVLALAAGWILKDRYLVGMRHRKALAIAGLAAATLLPILVGVAFLLPLVKLTQVIGVQD